MQKILQNFKEPDVQSVSYVASQKAKSYQNLTAENGSKQRFSLLQEKAVCLRTQAVSIKAQF